jgi:hypothetical protein
MEMGNIPEAGMILTFITKDVAVYDICGRPVMH